MKGLQALPIVTADAYAVERGDRLCRRICIPHTRIQPLHVLAAMSFRHVPPRRTFVLKFVQSVIRSLRASRSWLIQADVLRDSTSVSISSNFFVKNRKIKQAVFATRGYRLFFLVWRVEIATNLRYLHSPLFTLHSFLCRPNKPWRPVRSCCRRIRNNARFSARRGGIAAERNGAGSRGDRGNAAL